MSPNLRFEFLATWPGAILAAGSQRVPLVRPETGLGGGVLSRRDAVAKLRVFREVAVREVATENQNSLLICLPGGSGTDGVGRVRRRGPGTGWDAR